MVLLLHGNLRDFRRAVENDRRGSGLRKEGADLPRGVAFLDTDWVGAEYAECVAVVSTNDCFHFGSVHGNFDYMALTELHVHLEGTVDRETVRLLDPLLTEDAIRAAWDFANFAGFIGCFKFVAQRLRGPADYALITRRMIERFAIQGIGYAEVTLGAGVILWRGFDFDEVWLAIRESQKAACAATGVEVFWNLDAIRQFGAEHVMEVARVASRYVEDGAISFGIGGDERAGPARLFGEAYRYARDAGLRLTAHAGETDGADSVWAALEIGAERIGHGIRAADDADLMRRLREEDIPLEVSITSNVKTGAVGSLGEHPLRRLLDAGVPVTLNTDDPGIFETDLAREFEVARTVLGVSDEELRVIAESAVRYRFIEWGRSNPGASRL